MRMSIDATVGGKQQMNIFKFDRNILRSILIKAIFPGKRFNIFNYSTGNTLN